MIQLRICLFSLLLFGGYYGVSQSLGKPVTPEGFVYSQREKSTVVNYSVNSIENFRIVTTPDNHSSSNHKWKKPMVFLTFPLLVASEIAYSHNNKDLALGFATGGLVTSSIGLVWYIKDKKRK